MQQLSFYVDTMLFVMKQYEEEVNYKLLTEEEQDDGKYFKLNEKVLLRTDSKTQMEIFAQAVNNGIEKPNECRRKLDLKDADGGDQLIVNGNYIPLKEVGKQYDTVVAQAKKPEPIEEPDDPKKPSDDGKEGQQDGETAGTTVPEEE